MPRADPQKETTASSIKSTISKVLKKVKSKGASVTRKLLTQSKPKQDEAAVRWRSTPYELSTSKKAKIPSVDEVCVTPRLSKLMRWRKKVYPSDSAMVIDLVADEVSSFLHARLPVAHSLVLAYHGRC